MREGNPPHLVGPGAADKTASLKGSPLGGIGLNSRTIAILIRARKLGTMIWRPAYQAVSQAACLWLVGSVG